MSGLCEAANSVATLVPAPQHTTLLWRLVSFCGAYAGVSTTSSSRSITVGVVGLAATTMGLIFGCCCDCCCCCSEPAFSPLDVADATACDFLKNDLISMVDVGRPRARTTSRSSSELAMATLEGAGLCASPSFPKKKARNSKLEQLGCLSPVWIAGPWCATGATGNNTA